ncbi:unnamed protein product [Rotaria sp. Silwood2]|nr:unnamed protein product [Rotaria sp. Silwood2]CAF3352142.1 unnamed protein product [Rotaria sp. Silwood2]CAF4142471.1 unnamed protein product [Rotaria sp. Silwood2]
MARYQPFGHPVQIVTLTEDHKFKLDQDELKKILYHELAIGKKISLVSIAGDFRKGKSFMLDFFLRYLQAQGNSEWIGREDEPLTGFGWRGGTTRHTIGMIMWSEPLLLSLPNGEEIAVFLMDTQGTYDSYSTEFENTFIFALTLLVSSVTLYNIMHNIQEYDLQHLSIFAEYGVLALDAKHNSPFQQITFLVRDWQFKKDRRYGFEGGEEYLSDCLKIQEKQPEELKLLRERLPKCFREVNCFLMPHPGLEVTTGEDFNGKLAYIDKDFKKQLLTLVPEIFCLDNKNFIKKINEQHISSKDLFEYFRVDTVMATGRIHCLTAVSAAKDYYSHQMEKYCGDDRPYIHPHQLDAFHQNFLQEAIEKFRHAPKIADEKIKEDYEKKLEAEIDELHTKFKNNNNSKNVFAFSRTPITLILSMVLCYLMAGVFNILYLNVISFILMFIFFVCFVLLFVWLFTNGQRKYAEINKYINYFTVFLWNNVS